MAGPFHTGQAASQQRCRLLVFEGREQALRDAIVDAENKVDQAVDWHQLQRAVTRLSSLRRQLAALLG